MIIFLGWLIRIKCRLFELSSARVICRMLVVAIVLTCGPCAPMQLCGTFTSRTFARTFVTPLPLLNCSGHLLARQAPVLVSLRLAMLVPTLP